jgi:hypothetical protein
MIRMDKKGWIITAAIIIAIAVFAFLLAWPFVNNYIIQSQPLNQSLGYQCSINPTYSPKCNQILSTPQNLGSP